MSPNPFTVAPDASVDEALGLMNAHGIRHLPVVGNGDLVGLVTDTQLRTAWFPSLLDELLVHNVMTDNPFVIDEDSTVYEAARLLYNHKLTGVLVQSQGKLTGILTLADILGLFVNLLGLLTDTCRVDVALKPQKDSLDKVHQLICRHGGEVVSVALLSSEPSRRVYSFRLEKIELEPIVQALKEAGHEVLD